MTLFGAIQTAFGLVLVAYFIIILFDSGPGDFT